jgi:uncharacterized DUF497 family protein
MLLERLAKEISKNVRLANFRRHTHTSVAVGMLTTYIHRQHNRRVTGGVEFDWDAENIGHLKRHRVTPAEFEELMSGDPVYLEYQTRTEEGRYKVPGVTKAGRVLIGVWASRAGKIRAVTAYGASRVYQDPYWETPG